MMSYDAARNFIQNISQSGIVLGLDSIKDLMEKLDNVQDKIPMIHIAGTNGKGSVGAYLCSIFQEAGLSVGRYCSPAVFSPLEVYQYNGKCIEEEEYASIVSQVKRACDIMVSEKKPLPTVFEIETAIAFCYFYQKAPDIVLLETGMGGKEDATNIIHNPIATVFTTIGRDHMAFLGEELSSIAEQKAGIIKTGCSVFFAPQESVVEEILKNKASQKACPVTGVAEREMQYISMTEDLLCFSYKGMHYQTQMLGFYQIRNASLAIEISDWYLSGKEYPKQKRQAIISKGISDATWNGRFEVLSKKPFFVIDGAHNENAIEVLETTIENCFTNRNITYIIGVLADKEYKKMLKVMLPYANKVITVTPNHNRALDGRILAKEAENYHDNVRFCSNIEEAVRLALVEADMVLAFGSLSYLAEIKQYYKTINESGNIHD